MSLYRPTVPRTFGEEGDVQTTGMGRRRGRRKEDAIKSYNVQHTLGKNTLGRGRRVMYRPTVNQTFGAEGDV